MRIASAGVPSGIVAATLEPRSAPRTVSTGTFQAHLSPPSRPARSPARASAATSAPAAADAPFAQHVAAVASRLRIRPEDLLAVMRFESGLRPDAINPTSHAVGLIQFLPSTAADLLGLPASQPDREARAVRTFAAMSADEQLAYVEAYFDRALGGRGTSSLRDTYMAVLWPAAVGHDDSFVIARAGAASSGERSVYRQNAALDANGDGTITAGEAAAMVARVRG